MEYDIFISYSRHDYSHCESMATFLSECGYRVWWDKNLSAGERFVDKIQKAIDSSRCIIVLWSSSSIESSWVESEASEGLNRKVLIPILIDDVIPPLPFRSLHTLNFVDFHKDENNKILISSIRNIIIDTDDHTEHTLRIIKASIVKKSFLKVIIKVYIGENTHTVVCSNSISSQKLKVDNILVYEHHSYSEFINKFDFIIKDGSNIYNSNLYIHVNRFGYKIQLIELIINNKSIVKFDRNKHRIERSGSLKYTGNLSEINKLLLKIFNRHEALVDHIIHPNIQESTLKKLHNNYNIEKNNIILSYDQKNLLVYTSNDIRWKIMNRYLITPYTVFKDNDLIVEDGIQNYKISIGDIVKYSFITTTQKEHMLDLFFNIKNLVINKHNLFVFDYLNEVNISNLTKEQCLVLEQLYLFSFSNKFIIYPETKNNTHINEFKERVKENKEKTALGFYDTSFRKKYKTGIIFFEDKCIILFDDYFTFQYNELSTLGHKDTLFQMDLFSEKAGPVSVAGGGYLAKDMKQLLKNIENSLSINSNK